ncbi:hypothetical protein [Laspinema olomoucense]|uniref:hypothetical protein n=1 Tax=Laspinema olomoucense TaxID=3231600 RepID=UPI0021BABFDB|nr:hypothetical protein [Laspinema sp. D3d]MCT7971174.1 hypothetical protein [Laspinema sp. D3d]
MIEFYRFTQVKNQLPQHWSLTEIEIDESSINPGFQVWESLSQVVGVGLGIDPMYGEAFMDYPYILIIEASNYYEAEGEWIAVRCEDVKSVKYVSSVHLVDWITKSLTITDCLELSGQELRLLELWIKKNSTNIQHKFVETLKKI